MRALVTALALAALVATALATAPAGAAVLYDQSGGAGVDGVPAQEFPGKPADTSQAADDFVVPYGQHWVPSELDLIGSGAAGERPFNVSLHEEFGAYRLGPGRQLFGAGAVAATGGPNFAVPLQGAPLLEPGRYWVAVQAVGDDGPWRWNPQPIRYGERAIWQNPGNGLGTDCIEWWFREGCLAKPAGEPDQAFSLEGSYKQILRVGSYGNTGRVVSSPPGLDCPGVCSATFDRGAVVTLTGLPARPNMEFTGWRRGPALAPSGPPISAPAPTDLPCPDPGRGPCRLTLSEDMTIYGTYELASRIAIGRLKRNLGAGTAKLFVKLRVAGALSMSGKGVKAFRESEAKPGLVRVPVIAKGGARHRLDRTGVAKVALRLEFRASGNTARTWVKPVTLRRKLAP